MIYALKEAIALSETNTPSPLLDGFAMGNPISEHHGIRCCPAIKENTDKKYIVKIISIPASQVQMDALLLAGAYKDPSDAMDYFREKGEEVLNEAKLLKKLSKLEGFLAYEGWQMEPITRHRLGYEIYLLGSYKRSLERYMRHNAITHLEAVNLGLDMCSALSVCRQAGALYVDLKPSNIFLSDKKEYRIGDLGFLPLDSLRYAALPEKYLSSYTAPELYDPMASVSMSTDTYALGMILYQLYNDGVLPFRGQAPEEGLPSPVHADYELAEIIMKAIHPDPEQRYLDPAEMGKALAEYMQRNSINDVAITPLRTKKAKKKKAILPPKEPDPVQEPVEEAAVIEETKADADSPEVIEEAAADVSEPSKPEAVAEVPVEAEMEAEEETATTAKTALEEAVGAEAEPEEEIPVEPEIPAEPELPEEIPEEPEEAEETPAEAVDAEPEPEEEPLALSEELSRILAKADDLISHETPEGIHIPEEEEPPNPFAFALDEEEIDDSDIPYDPLMDEEPEADSGKKKKKSEKKFADPKYKRRKKRFLAAVLTLLFLALAAVGGKWYYENLYLQTIDAITITGDRSQIMVQVDSQIDEGLLSVTCLDTYGKSETKALTDGQAVFTGLQSNTMYTIRVNIDGFHALVGKTSDIFTTDATTNILSFTSVAGPEDGSVVLNFTVGGDEPDHWTLIYGTEGEAEIEKTFTGHTVTITGLSLGKRYTFTLEAGGHQTLGGETTLELMASRLILAENISVTSANGSDITVHWNSPGDIVVDSWDVRCYNARGYDQSLTVADTQVTFSGIDTSAEYTIEVTAAGMTQPARTGITANPISVGSLNVDESDPAKLKLSWDHTGNAPEDGWLLLYTIDGGENHVVKCTKASAEVSPKIPGAKYTFTLEAGDGTSIFNNVHTCTIADAPTFEANKLTADMLTIDLLKTPEEENWYYENISAEQLTDQFQSGDRISIALRSSDTFYLPGSRTAVLFAIRDSYGNVLSQHTTLEEIVWKNIWTGGDSKNGELNVPNAPTNPGSYVLDLYFDGMHVAELPFTIS